jgi:thiol-disulfide isomerase/thioredoxin
MKNRKLYSIATLALALIFGCTPSNYELTGNLNGVADGTELELIPGATHKEEEPESTTIVKDGQFKFTGKLPEPRLYYLSVKGCRGIARIFLENNKIKLSADVEFKENGNNKSANFKNVNVLGSESHQLYLEKTKFRKEQEQMYEKMHADYAGITQQVGEARREKNKEKLDSLTKTDDYLKMAQAEKDFFNFVEASSKKAFSDNKDTWWGPFLMLDVMSYYTPEQQPIFNEFSETAKNSYYGQILKALVFPKTFTGEQIPEFSITNEKGESIPFSKFAEEKKFVYIDFWASWCAPCRKEIPNLKKIYAEYASKGFEIISISIDSDKKAWEEALKKEQMPWHNFLDADKSLRILFNVKAVPSCFLVDATGKIILETHKSEELRQKLEKL